MKVFNINTPIPPLATLVEAQFIDPPDPTKRNRPVPRLFRCPYDGCGATFQHYTQVNLHNELAHNCSRCGYVFLDVNSHVCSQVGGNRDDSNEPRFLELGQFELVQAVHSGGLFLFKREFLNVINEYQRVFEATKSDIFMIYSQFLEVYNGIKVYCEYESTLERLKDGMIMNRPIHSPFIRCTNKKFVKSTIESAFNYLVVSLSLYEAEGSGWKLNNVPVVKLKIVPYKPLITRQVPQVNPSGDGYIPLPSHLRRKGIINIKTYTSRCFMLSIIAHFYRHEIGEQEVDQENYKPVELKDKSKHKRLLENPLSYSSIVKRVDGTEIDFEGFRQTVCLSDITRFEEKNSIQINVFMLKGKDVYPAKISDFMFVKKVDLLLLQDTKQDAGHYCLITDLSKFYHKRGLKKLDTCRGCFKPISVSNTRHNIVCRKQGIVEYITPKESCYKFSAFKAHMDVQYKMVYKIIPYAEAMPCLFSGGKYTLASNSVKAAGYSLVVLDPFWKIYKQKTYFAFDAIEDLLSTIHDLGMEIQEIVKTTYIPLRVTEELKKIKQDCTKCPLCHEHLTKKRPAAYNHTHFDGYLYSIICTKCNILAKKVALRIFCHDLNSEQFKLILESLNPLTLKEMKIIAKDSEHIVSLTWKRFLQFQNTYELLNSPIEEIAYNFSTSFERSGNPFICTILSAGFQHKAEVRHSSKGILFPETRLSAARSLQEFPSLEECNVNVDLPSQTNLYENSYLTYYAFGCEDLLSYAKVYATVCTLQLADALREITSWSTKNLNLSPLHYLTLASFGFDCAFLHTGASFEYVPDKEIVDWIKAGLRPGMSFSNVQVATANNERIGRYNGKPEERTHIFELDLTAAYPYSMTRGLVEGGYEWILGYEANQINWMSIEDDGNFGYIIEVDAFVPSYVHDEFNELPPFFIKKSISMQEFSPYQKQLYETVNPDPSREKYVGSLAPQKNYLLTHQMLKYFISRGMKVTKVHKALKFKSSPYLKPAMEYLMYLKSEAKSQGNLLIESIIKPALCRIYGKFHSDSSALTNIQPCNSKETCWDLASRDNFENVTIISDNLTLFHMTQGKPSNTYNIVNAFLILEYCKEVMYRQLDFLRRHFDNQVVLLGGETDSLRVMIRDPHNIFMNKMKDLKGMLDFSRLPIAHELYSDNIKDKLGFWKVTELNIYQFVSVKSKMLSYITVCDSCFNVVSPECSTCQRSNQKLIMVGYNEAIKRQVDHEFLYRLVMDGSVDRWLEENRFHLRSSALDVRRYFVDQEHSLAFGHYKIEKQ